VLDARRSLAPPVAVHILIVWEVGMAITTKSGGRRKMGSKTRRRASTEVRTEMRHIRSGKNKVKSRNEAGAIGLAKARQKKVAKKGSRKRKG
jgi:hypothetical protein